LLGERVVEAQGHSEGNFYRSRRGWQAVAEVIGSRADRRKRAARQRWRFPSTVLGRPGLLEPAEVRRVSQG
jgi:hypothetical protein